MLNEMNRNESLQSFTATISHEFRTPLGTSLMFLEMLLRQQLPASATHIINLIISQLNLLLSQVNDVLDIKLIEEGVFEPKIEQFNPLQVLDFIKMMFQSQADMQRTLIDYETVHAKDLALAIDVEYNRTLLLHCDLPEILFGDQIRLK